MKINKTDRCLSREDFGVILEYYYSGDNLDSAYTSYLRGCFSSSNPSSMAHLAHYNLFVWALSDAEDIVKKLRLLQEALDV